MILKFKGYIIYYLLLFFYIFYCLPSRLEVLDIINSIPPIAKKRIVVIDAGHGGIDGGTNYGEILEKNINLDLSLKLKEYLLESNTKVIMTREEDTSLDHLNNYSTSRHTRDLRARIDIIHQAEADIFVSLHVDHRIRQSWQQGPIVLYYPYHQQSKRLAESIQARLNNLVYKGSKIKSHQILKRNNLYILKSRQVPGVIIEVGFITNDLDRKLLVDNDYQDILVEAIYQGIADYFSGFQFLD